MPRVTGGVGQVVYASVAQIMGRFSHNSEELLPIVLTVALWGTEWKGGSLQCQCDNAAVVAIMRSGWSKNAPVKMSLHPCSQTGNCVVWGAYSWKGEWPCRCSVPE